MTYDEMLEILEDYQQLVSQIFISTHEDWVRDLICQFDQDHGLGDDE